MWSATDTLGNGEWATGANVELAYAQITADYAMGTAVAAVPGLSITFATTDRPAMIEAYPAGFYCNAQATISYQLRNAAGTILRAGVANCSTTTGFDFPTSLKLRVPAGTPSETYTLFAWVSAGSPSSRYLNPSPRAEFGSLPNAAFIQAVSV